MIAARNAGDARNPDGAGDGMGRNASGDPGDNFHNTQKTLPWAMNPAADYLTDTRMQWTRAQDQAHPDRPCAWCLHPRNSPECNFAEGHTPYMETFGGAG